MEVLLIIGIIMVIVFALVCKAMSDWYDQKVEKETRKAYKEGFQSGTADTANEIMFQVQSAMKSKDESLDRLL